MIGFLTGVAVNIVLGQLPDLVGSDVSGAFALAKAWHLLLDPGQHRPRLAGHRVCRPSLILVVLGSTRLAAYSSLIALAIAHGGGDRGCGADTVQRVSDVGEIPQGLPLAALPQLSDLSFDVVSGALAVAALVLIQGAGVSESAPNPDGARSEPNRDFLAQGVGNLLSGLFRGQPVGGSVGQTALSVAAGAPDFLDQFGNAQIVLGRALLEQQRLDEAELVFRRGRAQPVTAFLCQPPRSRLDGPRRSRITSGR